jgi:hypothetical protein
MANLSPAQIDSMNNAKAGNPASQRQAKQSKPKASKALAITAGHQKLATTLQSSQVVLDEMSAGMEDFSEDFSDRVAEIVEDGLTAAWQKTGDKIAAIEVPDFFGGSRQSLFALKPTRTLSTLPAAEQTVEVPAIAAS